MVRVHEVDLGQLGVGFPSGQVGMVVAQPHVCFTDDEPFTLVPEMTERAFGYIDTTLALALRRVHGVEKTHFTIFPECTLPGLAGVDRVTAALTQENWPTETVVIGGVDGLNREQFSELLLRPNTSYDAAGVDLERIREGQWINCSVTWVKLPNGEVRSWVQPKIAPAWVERNVQYLSMHKGQSVLLFKGTYSNSRAPYRFATLLCFDWIGSVDNRRIWQWLLQGIDDIAAAREATLPLTWLFVAQCNPEPSHASFMLQVPQFYDPLQYPNVNRENTCLVMANVAGNPVPGKAKQFGQSAVIFTPNRFMKPGCMPTYCNGGEPQRHGQPLENLRDAVFRERGACVHSFAVRNPDTVPLGSAGKVLAVEEPTVHPLGGGVDPRTPSDVVPAVVKWVNDELDDTDKCLAIKFPKLALVAAIETAHKKSAEAIRKLPAKALNNSLLVASPGTTCESADSWTAREVGAVSHLLQTFSILDVAQYPATFHGQGAQATIQKGDSSLEVVAVIGRSHEECDRHIMERAVPHRGALLMISRDEQNTSWNAKERTIFDQVSADSAEYIITDPRSAVLRVSYQDILQAYQRAANEIELKESINAAIS